MLTSRSACEEPIGVRQSKGSRSYRSRGLFERKMLRGRHTSERGGRHGKRTFCTGGEVSWSTCAPRSGTRGVRQRGDEVGSGRGVSRKGGKRCCPACRTRPGSRAVHQR